MFPDWEKKILTQVQHITKSDMSPLVEDDFKKGSNINCWWWTSMGSPTQWSLLSLLVSY